MKDYSNLNDYEIMYMVAENDDSAKELMFEKYKPIIEKYARKYYAVGKNFGLELDDFIQEGYFGLYCALSNYTPFKNTIFYTYAIISIKSKMNNLLINSSNGKSSVLNNSLSLNQYLDEDGTTLFDFIEDKNALIPDIEVERKELVAEIKRNIYELQLDESIVFELKFNGFSIKDISKLLSISEQKARNILSRVKKKLIINN